VCGRRGAGDFAVRGCPVGFVDAGNAETQMLFFFEKKQHQVDGTSGFSGNWVRENNCILYK
jgi:hypothetical protein